jgi:hypothetical protein
MDRLGGADDGGQEGHPPSPEHTMVVREVRIAASSFVLTAFAIVALHLLLK